ncbi:MAG TPA: hypothetical protein VK327_08480 [Candidatus Paceibacterota bacterium]|nr:hypothetical protein [Candidatus Paceibacterota bacterium]
MRMLLILCAVSVLMSGCGRRDAKLRSSIIGSWSQDGAHTLIFSTNGHYQSIFPSPKSQTYEGSWHIYRGLLIMTTQTSNSVPFSNVSNVESLKVLIDGDTLMLEWGTNHYNRHYRLK